MIRVKNNRFSSGSTLTEIIIVIGIFGIIISGVFVFVRLTIRGDDNNIKQIIIQNNARKAQSTMVSDIRGMMYSNSGSYPVYQAEEQSLIFFTNTDEDIDAERVRYFIEGNELKKGVIEPTGYPPEYIIDNEEISILSKHVVNDTESIFKYYDRNYDGTSDPMEYPVNKSNIMLININLIIDPNLGKSPKEIVVTSDVQLRNLKDNL
jgi:type II secretory pathway pseudopilin PulG